MISGIPVEGSVEMPGLRRVAIVNPVADVSDDALEAANEIQRRGGRRKISTPVRKWFVRSRDGEIPPMAKLYRGGRSGTVALKLYLGLIWRSSKPPYGTEVVPRAWAVLLDLYDPDVAGAKRIRGALRKLEEAELIEVKRSPNAPSRVVLLDESGSGEAYELPSTSYMKSRSSKSGANLALDPDVYFRVPSVLWTVGYMQKLSGPGLVMLLILLAEQAHSKPVWFSTEEFPSRYFISSSTRTKGTKELQELNLLNVLSVPLPQDMNGSSFDPRRRRYLYRLSSFIEHELGSASESE